MRVSQGRNSAKILWYPASKMAPNDPASWNPCPRGLDSEENRVNVTEVKICDLKTRAKKACVGVLSSALSLSWISHSGEAMLRAALWNSSTC